MLLGAFSLAEDALADSAITRLLTIKSALHQWAETNDSGSLRHSCHQHRYSHNNLPWSLYPSHTGVTVTQNNRRLVLLFQASPLP